MENLKMMSWATGESRVADTLTMTASQFLADWEQEFPLADYELDCEITQREIDAALRFGADSEETA